MANPIFLLSHLVRRFDIGWWRFAGPSHDLAVEADLAEMGDDSVFVMQGKNTRYNF